jgi:hypothetical protein
MSAEPAAMPNLYQRLARIAADVGRIKATGKTQQNQPTLSIVDVEDALRERIAAHGVVTGYHWNTPPTIVGEIKGEKGTVTLWQADLTVWFVNADSPADMREDRVFDIGTSPSAAVSFALKRLYRALFHLADTEDETRSARVQPPVRKPTEAPAPKPPVSAIDGDGTKPSNERASLARRINEAAKTIGWDNTTLRGHALKQFGKHSPDQLTDEELQTLLDEVEGLALSKSGASA